MIIYTVRDQDKCRRILGDDDGQIFDCLLYSDNSISIAVTYDQVPSLGNNFKERLVVALDMMAEDAQPAQLQVTDSASPPKSMVEDVSNYKYITNYISSATKRKDGLWDIDGLVGVWKLVKNQGKWTSAREAHQLPDLVTAYYGNKNYAGMFGRVKEGEPRGKEQLVKDGHVVKFDQPKKFVAKKYSAEYGPRLRGGAGWITVTKPLGCVLDDYHAPQIDSPEIAYIMEDPASFLARFKFA